MASSGRPTELSDSTLVAFYLDSNSQIALPLHTAGFCNPVSAKQRPRRKARSSLQECHEHAESRQDRLMLAPT